MRREEGNKMKSLAILILTISVLVFTAVASQAEEGSIKLTALSEVDIEVINDKGEKEIKRVDAASAKVVPGDTVIFSVLYENVGKEATDNVVITNPVPEHMTYLSGTASGEAASIDFSVDKGATYKLPKDLRIKNKEGKEVLAEPSDYTDIRWTLNGPLPSGAKGAVSFRATLN